MNGSRKTRVSAARLNGWRAWISLLIEWLQRLQPPKTAVLIGAALVVGVGAGFGAIIFPWLINSFTTLAFAGGSQALTFLGRYYVLLIPAIGGLVVGPLVYWFAREAKGHGVPEVMEAVALRGGRIRPIVVVIKALASSICIGTGGSAGREGPIVQIGSALGSTIGQVLRMSDDRIRMLVACGAAGGIAATFNAPVAGVIFALEVILGEFTAGHFSTVVISSVTANVVSRVFLGDVPAFTVPGYTLHSPWELLLYALLGVISAPVGVGFSRILYWLEDVFNAWNFPEYLKPAVGGLGVGAIGLYTPQVFGIGYDAIEAVLGNEVVLSSVALLLVAKIMATSLTLGSGGSGGVFAPSLFMGAMLGGAFGDLVHRWLPNITALPGAYAMVGMAAVFAAGARAPLSAIIILFEMTGDYRVILPLMLATVIATLLAQYLEPESIYTMKLSRRGVHLERGRDIDVMRSFHVAEVMHTPAPTLPENAPFHQVVEQFLDSQDPYYYLMDREQKLAGLVSLHDVKEFLSEGGLEGLVIARDLARPISTTTHPQETLAECLRKLAEADLEQLPVIDVNPVSKLVGVVTQRDLIDLYDRQVLRREFIGTASVTASQDRNTLTLPHRYTVVPFPLPAAYVGKTLRELDLRARYHVTVIAVRTETSSGSRDNLPQPEQLLQAGEILVLAGYREDIADLRRSLT